MKTATEGLKHSPKGYNAIGFEYKGYDVYVKSYRQYLFFYIIDEKTRVITVLRVMQKGMNWKFILKRWLKDNI